MFLLVPAYLGCPGQTAVKWLLLSLLTTANSASSNLTDNSDSSRKTKHWILHVKINKCRRQTFSDDYSQEFVIYNETVIDISLVVAYHHKFHHQNKKQLYIVCWYVRFCWHPSLT